MTTPKRCTICGINLAAPKGSEGPDPGSWCVGCRVAYWKGYDAGRRGRGERKPGTRKRAATK
jgi:hypothetical protein